MSFKYQITNIAPCKYVLNVGKVPIVIFMSQTLLDATKENFWQEVINLASFPGVTKVVVTPDGQAGGKGLPGCGVAVETDGSVIIPCVAGFDISCGMQAVQTNIPREALIDKGRRRQWINAVVQRMALGAGRHQAPKQRKFSDRMFQEILRHGATAITGDPNILENLERKFLPVNSDNLIHIEQAQRGQGQLGSEGSGNHFVSLELAMLIEMGIILIHTGSRGYGHGTATHFYNVGAELLGLPNGRKEHCYFHTDTKVGQQYIACMNAAANYAIVNRLTILSAVQEATEEVYGAETSLIYDISHNMIQEEDGKLIHRKGATRAFPAGHHSLVGTKWEKTGHPILIPGSMNSPSAILYAKEGAKDSLYTINHGCGRNLGREEAKRLLADHQQEIDGEMEENDVIMNTRKTPLDECVHAYKDIDEVLLAVETAGLAEVAIKVTPRAVIKGED